MSLKSEIEKLKKLQNEIKSVRNQINEVIVRGGGKQSNSLNEIPQNIERMINNQNSIKIGEITKESIKTESFDVNINLDFTPSRVLVAIIQNDYFGENVDKKVVQAFADSTINKSANTGYVDIYDKRKTCLWISEVSKTKFKINTNFMYAKTNVSIKWYAIK